MIVNTGNDYAQGIFGITVMGSDSCVAIYRCVRFRRSTAPATSNNPPISGQNARGEFIVGNCFGAAHALMITSSIAASVAAPTVANRVGFIGNTTLGDVLTCPRVQETNRRRRLLGCEFKRVVATDGYIVVVAVDLEMFTRMSTDV
jgi:hypothetical protein